jgi:hypothetical protein
MMFAVPPHARKIQWGPDEEKYKRVFMLVEPSVLTLNVMRMPLLPPKSDSRLSTDGLREVGMMRPWPRAARTSVPLFGSMLYFCLQASVMGVP